MAVKIRLARHGRHKVPVYRIVVADGEMKRDGRHLERVGTLNTLTNPATVTLDQERVRYWVGVGAKPTDTVAALIEKQMPGYLKEIESGRRARIRAARAKRKARHAGKAKTAKAPSKKKSSAKAQPSA